MSVRQRKYLLLTLIIAFMIACIYIATNTPLVHTVLAQMANSPIYKIPESNTVCFVSAFDDDAAMFKSGITAANDAGLKLTIFVKANWAEQNEDEVKYAIKSGHDIQLYGRDSEKEEITAEIINEDKKKLECITGKDVSYYMPYSGEYKGILSSMLNELKLVLWSKDTRAFAASSDNDFSNIISQRANHGDIVYILLNERFCNSINNAVSKLKQRGLICKTVSDCLRR